MTPHVGRKGHQYCCAGAGGQVHQASTDTTLVGRKRGASSLLPTWPPIDIMGSGEGSPLPLENGESSGFPLADIGEGGTMIFSVYGNGSVLVLTLPCSVVY